MPKMNLSGDQFGRLTAIHVYETEKTGTYWRCFCECGNYKNVFIGHLRSGKIRSCGCLFGDIEHNGGVAKHGKARTPEHITWCAMRNRCLSPTTNGYERYGGIGVTICPEWDDFSVFLNDMGKRPSKHHTLDRIDATGNYELGNCRWATPKEQSINKRNSKRYFINGRKFNTAKEAGLFFGVCGSTILRWCDKKWNCWSKPLYG